MTTTAQLIRKYIIIILIIAAVGTAAYFILPVSIPIIAALLTALILTPSVNALARRTKIGRNIAVFIVFIIFLLVSSFVIYIIFTRALAQVNQFVENLPRTINEFNIAWMNLLEQMSAQFDQYSQELVQEIDQTVSRQLDEMRTWFQEINIIGHVTNVLMSIPQYIVSLLVYLIALYLFLLDLPRLKKQLYSFFTEETAEKVSFMGSRLAFVIIGFFKAQFLVSIIIFIVTFTSLMFIAPEVALIMSILIWLIDFIPIIGSIAVLAPWAGFHIIAGNTILAVQLLVLATVLLTIRRTVEPKVMGHHIGLSPLATLISLYIGLMLLGAIGFILGPLLVILFQSAREAGIIKFNFKI